jgi:hypothetical protein
VVESTWERLELPLLRALYALEQTNWHAPPSPPPIHAATNLDEMKKRLLRDLEPPSLATMSEELEDLDTVYTRLADQLCQEIGLSRHEVYRALWRLNQDGYLVGKRLSGHALRAIGAWPNENSYDAILRVLEETMEAEQDPEAKNRLRQFLGFLQGLGREVGTSLLTEWLKRTTGLA